MTTFQERTYTVEEFEEFVLLPENADKLFEFIGGEIVEVPSNLHSSIIAQRIAGEIYIYLKQNDIGYLSGESGSYQVFGERYAPDVAFLSYVKQQEVSNKGYNPNPPDLAVEVMSSERKSESEQMMIKVVNYLAAGTIVWIVRPEKKTAEVYQPGKPVITLHEKDALDGGNILPGLSIKLSDIFK
jgi:Uma2 family endonuclease